MFELIGMIVVGFIGIFVLSGVFFCISTIFKDKNKLINEAAYYRQRCYVLEHELSKWTVKNGLITYENK